MASLLLNLSDELLAEVRLRAGSRKMTVWILDAVVRKLDVVKADERAKLALVGVSSSGKSGVE